MYKVFIYSNLWHFIYNRKHQDYVYLREYQSTLQEYGIIWDVKLRYLKLWCYDKTLKYKHNQKQLDKLERPFWEYPPQ